MSKTRELDRMTADLLDKAETVADGARVGWVTTNRGRWRAVVKLARKRRPEIANYGGDLHFPNGTVVTPFFTNQ